MKKLDIMKKVLWIISFIMVCASQSIMAQVYNFDLDATLLSKLGTHKKGDRSEMKSDVLQYIQTVQEQGLEA